LNLIFFHIIKKKDHRDLFFAYCNEFLQIEYFTDIGVKTLNYLDKLFQWDNLQKSQFYKGLPQLLKRLPYRVVLHRVLPALYKELVNPPMIPFVLPSILQVMEITEIDEFREHILPNLKPVLALEDPPQVSTCFLSLSHQNNKNSIKL